MVCFVVWIFRQPENTTTCRGSNVTISCGYVSGTALPVTWMVNGSSFDEETLMNSPLYQVNNPKSPSFYSLTVFSINGNTTFRCIINSTSSPTSTVGTVTVIGAYIHTVHTIMYAVICCIHPTYSLNSYFSYQCC